MKENFCLTNQINLYYSYQYHFRAGYIIGMLNVAKMINVSFQIPGYIDEDDESYNNLIFLITTSIVYPTI